MKDRVPIHGAGLESFDVEGLLPHSSILFSLFVRVFVVVMTLPLGSGVKFIPRVLCAVGLTLGLIPCLPAYTTTIPTLWASQITTEVTLGLLLSLPVRLFVEGAHTLGEFIDTARGQTMGAVQDPLNGPVGSDLAAIFKVAALTSTLYFGGLLLLVEALSDSISGFPPGPGTDLLDLLVHGASIQLLFAPLSSTCSLAVLWIVPYMAIDLFAALAHRMCQALSFSQVSLFLKGVATFVLLALLCNDAVSTTGLWIRPADPRMLIEVLLK